MTFPRRLFTVDQCTFTALMSITASSGPQLEVALNNVHAANQNPELEGALKQFTEAVLAETTLAASQKNEIVEQLTALTDQLAKPREGQRLGVVKAFVVGIATNIATTPLVAHWDAIKRLIGL
ncbi:MAG: hypothetical protein ACRD2H_13165 [Terriglobales bacterium]